MGLLLFTSCTHELICARYFIPADFIGKMTIYFNKKDGQKEFDSEGCEIYRISEKGDFLSAFPLEQGFAYPHKTFRFFEVFKNDSVVEIPEFGKHEYLGDPTKNQDKKYVFYRGSGYENLNGSCPNYILVYYVDYGKNYKNYGAD
jgi:hypothetical protein